MIYQPLSILIVFLFADDSLLLDEVHSPSACASRLNHDLASISSWANQWLVTMNATKTKSMIFSSKRDKPDHPPLIMNGVTIDDLTVHEHLGLTLSSNLSWRAHILKIHQKASRKLNLLKPLKYRLSRYSLDVLYKSLVRSSLEYADVVWDGCSESDSNLLESLQIESARLVTGAMKGTNRVSLLRDVSWVELSERRKMHKLFLMYKLVNKLAPSYLSNLCPAFVSERSCYSLRSGNDLCLPYVRTERHKKSFLFSTTQLWNSLPSEVRMSSSLSIFKNNASKFMKFPTCNYLFFTGDRAASIFHTRLRLNFSALNYDLFKRNCSVSSACALCDAPVEDAKHYFLFCPSFAALRVILFASAAHLLGDNWLSASNKKKIDWLLNGVPGINFQINVNLFYAVQSFISQSNRFS